jgi:hypothetical protein
MLEPGSSRENVRRGRCKTISQHELGWWIACAQLNMKRGEKAIFPLSDALFLPRFGFINLLFNQLRESFPMGIGKHSERTHFLSTLYSINKGTLNINGSII